MPTTSIIDHFQFIYNYLSQVKMGYLNYILYCTYRLLLAHLSLSISVWNMLSWLYPILYIWVAFSQYMIIQLKLKLSISTAAFIIICFQPICNYPSQIEMRYFNCISYYIGCFQPICDYSITIQIGHVNNIHYGLFSAHLWLSISYWNGLL